MVLQSRLTSLEALHGRLKTACPDHKYLLCCHLTVPATVSCCSVCSVYCVSACRLAYRLSPELQQAVDTTVADTRTSASLQQVPAAQHS